MFPVVVALVVGALGWLMFSAMGTKAALMTISMVAVGVLAFRVLQRQDGGKAVPSDDEPEA